MRDNFIDLLQTIEYCRTNVVIIVRNIVIYFLLLINSNHKNILFKNTKYYMRQNTHLL